MSGHAWHDSLLWSIRPDCHHAAQDLLTKVKQSALTLTPDAAGLHRDNLWKQFTKDVARWMDLDELPIDMVEGGIAVVSVVGELLDFVNPFTANYPILTAAFDHCRISPEILATVVRFKTPGGTVAGLDECANALSLLAGDKLTVAQVDGGCYSAGYFLAAQCGSICCGATDHIGNIGTVSSLYDYSKLFENEGVRSVVKRTGPIKGIGIPGDPVTGLQEQFLQHICDAHFAHFRAAVINGRDMTDDEFTAVSDGSWWLGEEAVANKIIDRVSTLDETIALIREQLG